MSVEVLLFGIDGSHHSKVEEHLDAGQLQDVKHFLTTAHSSLMTKYQLEDYYKALAESPPAIISIHPIFRELCLQSTDFPMIPPIIPNTLPTFPPPTLWTEMKSLPNFTLPETESAPWKHFLIGNEAVFIAEEDTSDQEILMSLFDSGFSIKVFREIKSLIKRLLVMGYLNAIHNDSQLEGFLANIRRLHMARHALSTDRKVYTPPGGQPGAKVQETIINNPMVLFLLK